MTQIYKAIVILNSVLLAFLYQNLSPALAQSGNEFITHVATSDAYETWGNEGRKHYWRDLFEVNPAALYEDSGFESPYASGIQIQRQWSYVIGGPMGPTMTTYFSNFGSVTSPDTDDSTVKVTTLVDNDPNAPNTEQYREHIDIFATGVSHEDYYVLRARLVVGSIEGFHVSDWVYWVVNVQPVDPVYWSENDCLITLMFLFE